MIGNRAHTREFRSILRDVRKVRDWMVEGDEFELPVPISKPSDDNIKLRDKWISRRCDLRTCSGASAARLLVRSAATVGVRGLREPRSKFGDAIAVAGKPRCPL